MNIDTIKKRNEQLGISLSDSEYMKFEELALNSKSEKEFVDGLGIDDKRKCFELNSIIFFDGDKITFPEYPILDINHSCRVYNNDDKTFNGVAKEHLAEHIAYNKVFRPGTALFINGCCVNYGYLKEDRCSVISENIKNMLKKNPNISKTTPPYS